jgi:hypothetical protein
LELILTTGYTVFFIYLIGRLKFYQIEGIKPAVMKAAFIVKLLAAIILGLVYTYYYTERYTADTFKYFDDGAVLFSSVFHDPALYLKMITGIGKVTPEMQVYFDRMTNWYDTFSPFNDNRSMIRFNALIYPFTMGKYYVHAAVISFLSFTGIIAIIRVFARYHPSQVREAFLVFMILPSTLFWCSGLLKDSLALFVLGGVILYLDKYMNDDSFNAKSISGVVLLSLLLMVVKFQVFFILLPVIISSLALRQLLHNPVKTMIISGASFFVLLLSIDHFFLNDVLITLLHEKQNAFFTLAEESDAGSLINIPFLEPNISSLISVIPSGLFTGIFRPFITDQRNILMLVSGIENTAIIVFIIYAIVRGDLRNVRNSPFAVLCIYFSLSLFTLIGIITPVLGALVRYKALALPFMVTFFLIIVKDRIPVLKRIVDRIMT